MLLHSATRWVRIKTHLLNSWHHLSPLTAIAVGTPMARAGRDGQIAPQRTDVGGTEELWGPRAKHC